MNTQHLQYVVEIERTRSISQAAENLFIGQPNLSRILHDLEKTLGFRIFERTSRGVRPTERGAKFLLHARGVLREMEYIEALGPRHAVRSRLRVCLPRSARLFDLAAEYLASLASPGELEVTIRECHARQALQRLTVGEAELGVLRFRSEYLDYFDEQTAEREFSFQVLGRFKYELVLPRDHPLARRETIHMEDLAEYPQIIHGDAQRPRVRTEDTACRTIYTVDRMAQLQLLQTIWGVYTWLPPMPEQYLQRWGLIQKPCEDNTVVYQDALVYNPQYAMTEIEAGFVQYVIREYRK